MQRKKFLSTAVRIAAYKVEFTNFSCDFFFEEKCNFSPRSVRARSHGTTCSTAHLKIPSKSSADFVLRGNDCVFNIIFTNTRLLIKFRNSKMSKPKKYSTPHLLPVVRVSFRPCSRIVNYSLFHKCDYISF